MCSKDCTLASACFRTFQVYYLPTNSVGAYPNQVKIIILKFFYFYIKQIFLRDTLVSIFPRKALHG